MRINLLLGRLFDWDKTALKAFLVMISIPIVLLTASVAFDKIEDWIDPDPKPTCDKACMDEIMKDIDIDQIVDEVIRETR